MGNASNASLSGEEATITVEQYDAVELILSYRDADKSALFSGRIMGNRIEGTAVSSTSVAGKLVKLDGKWIALVVNEAPDFRQISSRVPQTMNVCQTNDDDHKAANEDCFIWSWDPLSAAFAGNRLTVERFDERGVSFIGMSQHGTAVLAAYTGKADGNRIQGSVEYISGDGHNWMGKWTATFTPVPARH